MIKLEISRIVTARKRTRTRTRTPILLLLVMLSMSVSTISSNGGGSASASASASVSASASASSSHLRHRREHNDDAILSNTAAATTTRRTIFMDGDDEHEHEHEDKHEDKHKESITKYAGGGRRRRQQGENENCRNSMENFILHDQGVKMHCSFLDRPDYQFGCTYQQVMEMCPVSCNLCPKADEIDDNDDFTSHSSSGGNNNDNDNDDDSVMYIDDDQFETTRTDDDRTIFVPSNTPAPSPSPCIDYAKTFKIKRYGDRVSCYDMLTRKYDYGCTWKRVQSFCPRTCNICGGVGGSVGGGRPNNADHTTNNGVVGSNSNNNNNSNHNFGGGGGGMDPDPNQNPNPDDDFFLPPDDTDPRDDDLNATTDPIPLPPRCVDKEESFRLQKNGSILTCRDISRMEYRLACTWARVRNMCPDTCGLC